MSDVHKNDVTWHSPLCEDKVYSSHGGYYWHLRDAHNISRKGEKLSDAQLHKIQEEERNAGVNGSNNSDMYESTDDCKCTIIHGCVLHIS